VQQEFDSVVGRDGGLATAPPTRVKEAAMWRTRGLVAAVALLAATGCTGSAAAQTAADFDRPVAADKPRAELSIRVDLAPAQSCEESFDLALYQDRRIELIEWDDQIGECSGRAIRVRYMSDELKQDELMKKVKELAEAASSAENGS
jgi:hypothetical protein